MTRKKTLILVGTLFILPVVLAQLVLEFGWYNKGVMNNGILLYPSEKVGWLQQSGQWRLVYTFPSFCDAQCESALFQLTQSLIAVGTERDRVSSIVLMPTEQSIDDIKIGYQNISSLQHAFLSALPYSENAIYIVDPFNNLIMAYPVPQGKVAQITQGKGLLSDLRVLMKLSKLR
ncbi:hypothetical protein [Candidatus Enterovibrio escicola]|uniref:Cytochrome oxidase biogenesis protein Sco1/SenC/PrrC, copper metallochaperone n=1 Tax=Candidatus Enterovibrio escicola TaxID=1927127 RepID=A0A2A5T4Y4_9GAMM|nr:hypothetical protein [Candidatus Enterovibrio escacola]PCS23213.1 hypothetical protein BTN49_1209 [Candidatus Enterovibrio escacola]